MMTTRPKCITTRWFDQIFLKLMWYYHNLRVRDWRAYFGIATLGLIFGLDFAHIDYDILMKFVVSCTLYLAFAFSINNCFDVKCDSTTSKRRKNPIATGLISLREGIVLSMGIALAGLVTNYVWFNTRVLTIYILLIFLAAGYSIPPLRFKTVPVIDVISHGLFFGSLLFLYGLSIAGNINHCMVLIALSLFMGSVILELRNHLEDVDADLKAGVRTTVCWLGPSTTKKIMSPLYAVHYFLLILIIWIAGFRVTPLLPIIIIFILLISLRYCNTHDRITDFNSVLVYTTAGVLCLCGGMT